MLYLIYIVIVLLLMPMISTHSSVDKLFYIILSLALPIAGIFIYWFIFRRSLSFLHYLLRPIFAVNKQRI